MKDSFGNEMKVEIKKEGNRIIHMIVYTLSRGKTTLKGEHPKFKMGSDCVFPRRDSCNYGVGFKRCKYMKFVSLGRWVCSYEKKEQKAK